MRLKNGRPRTACSVRNRLVNSSQTGPDGVSQSECPVDVVMEFSPNNTDDAKRYRPPIPP